MIRSTTTKMGSHLRINGPSVFMHPVATSTYEGNREPRLASTGTWLAKTLEASPLQFGSYQIRAIKRVTPGP